MRSLKGNLFIVVFIGFFQACIPGSSNGKEVQEESIESEQSTLIERRAYYQREMAQKGFLFQEASPCTYPEEPGNRSGGSLESIQSLENGTEVSFSIYDDCCQKFLGEYKISGDTLKITYESIGIELCECKCLYHYKIRIREGIGDSTQVLIEKE